jgi:hypothetical protein
MLRVGEGLTAAWTSTRLEFFSKLRKPKLQHRGSLRKKNRILVPATALSLTESRMEFSATITDLRFSRLGKGETDNE